jgi:hypothetical protein
MNILYHSGIEPSYLRLIYGSLGCKGSRPETEVNHSLLALTNARSFASVVFHDVVHVHGAVV